MGTSYKTQLNFKSGKYSIQFETDNRDYFNQVQKACQKVMDKQHKANRKNKGIKGDTDDDR